MAEAGPGRGVSRREKKRIAPQLGESDSESIRGAGSGALAFRIGDEEGKSACALEADCNRRRPVADAAKEMSASPFLRRCAGRRREGRS